jgi:uncharacterized protein (DUF2062 family)
VADYTNDIIVVNDGSTDSTPKILPSFHFCRVLNQPSNLGKGRALRDGFTYARSLGYDCAITMDADGQHFAKDLHRFLDKLESSPGTLVVGARNMDQETVPSKSSFGNRFSNFWFKLETGIQLPDTQSGYRAYPLRALESIHFFTTKFEFEIEVLVRAAWEGIPVSSVPVTVYYPPPGVRVSHFRPVRDFVRISILNTVLVLVLILYIVPRNFLRGIFNPEKRRRFLNEHILNPEQSDSRKAASIGLGIFMGIVPIWGFQLAVAIFLAVLMRLNKALVIVFANISIPPMIPLIIFLSYKMGNIWMGENAVQLNFSKTITLQDIQTNLRQYLYGSVTLAIVAGLAATLASYLLMKLLRGKNLAAA